MKGEIKWFDTTKGYGFITGNDGTDYFFHVSEIGSSGGVIPEKGQTVYFDTVLTKKGAAAKDILFSEKMSDLKSVTAAEEKANKILADKADKISKLTERIEEEDALIKKAEEAMDLATDSGDINVYQAAKSERQNAFDAKEMHENLLDKRKMWSG